MESLQSLHMGMGSLQSLHMGMESLQSLHTCKVELGSHGVVRRLGHLQCDGGRQEGGAGKGR